MLCGLKYKITVFILSMIIIFMDVSKIAEVKSVHTGQIRLLKLRGVNVTVKHQ